MFWCELMCWLHLTTVRYYGALLQCTFSNCSNTVVTQCKYYYYYSYKDQTVELLQLCFIFCGQILERNDPNTDSLTAV